MTSSPQPSQIPTSLPWRSGLLAAVTFGGTLFLADTEAGSGLGLLAGLVLGGGLVGLVALQALGQLRARQREARWQETLRASAGGHGGPSADLDADLARLTDATRELLAQLGFDCHALEDVVTALNTAMEAAAAGSGGTRQVADEVANAVAVLAASIQAVAEDTQGIRDSVSVVESAAREAAAIVVSTEHLVQGSAESVTELQEVAEAIENATAEIATIADRTNLLALNATIESARAGEQGKGFAIVAQEVKELARSSANASGQIVSKIEMMRDRIQGTVMSIKEISQAMQKVTGMTSSLDDSVRQQTAGTERIAHRSEELGALSATLEASANRLAQTSQRTETEVTRAIEGARGIEQASAHIRQAVARFGQ